MSAPEASDRPAFPRRIAAGVWHVPAAFVFLLRRPALWPLAILPAMLAVVLSFAGLVLSWYYVPRVETALAPSREQVGDFLSLAASIVLGFLTLTSGILLGLALALTLTAPILDLLSRRTEQAMAGSTPDESKGLRFEVVQSLKGALFFTAAVPVAFLLGLVPFVGPPVAALWGAFALGFQLTDGPLTRRGLTFQEKLRWHRHWKAESLGFGLAGLLTLLVPLANLLMAPALTVGAARLVRELGGLGGGPPVRQDEALASAG
jgi:CysZ protein